MGKQENANFGEKIVLAEIPNNGCEESILLVTFT